MPGKLVVPVSLGRWTCRTCVLRSEAEPRQHLLASPCPSRMLSTSSDESTGLRINAAPRIDTGKQEEDGVFKQPARIVPASPSYFTMSPTFNDRMLMLQQYVRQCGSLPTLPPDKAPRAVWVTAASFRQPGGERVKASKYARVVPLLRRLNLIHPKLRPAGLQGLLESFRRSGSDEIPPPRPGKIDEIGRSRGSGGRKAASARVQLIEGTGEVVVNGRGLTQAFPRLHDRESALWPLKVTDRLDKYNVFVLVNGGGLTGQAESVTLALAKALMVQEPALKPALRKAGCVTRVAKVVERKKTGRVKARKRPQWVKR